MFESSRDRQFPNERNPAGTLAVCMPETAIAFIVHLASIVAGTSTCCE
jgi:hypothetical protein